MPKPIQLLRDGPGHWAVNDLPGGIHIASQDDVWLNIYRPMGLRRGVTVPDSSPQNRAANATPIPVSVSAGRWVIECPDCHGGEFAWPDDPWVMCGSCFNATLNGKWRPAIWPSDAEVALIEDILHARVLPFTRNWSPDTDSTDDLRRQNAARGEPEAITEAEWAGERPVRFKKPRRQTLRDGTEWRRHEPTWKRGPVRVERMALPSGWSAPTAIPEPTGDVSGEILYPDVSVPGGIV
jgi:hypothetical protein